MSVFDVLREKVKEGYEKVNPYVSKHVVEIVNQVEQEYNNDTVSQLAMKYAICLTQYGVDITEKLQTATQNALALEKAYLRGRQDERDAFEEWQKEYNNSWIPCSERLPDNDSDVLVWFEYFRFGEYNRLFQTIGISHTFRGEWSGFVNGSSGWQELKIIAWQPLPKPYQSQEGA